MAHGLKIAAAITAAALAVPLLIGVAACVGYAYAIHEHGDWIILRNPERACVAFSPETSQTSKPWLPRAGDGRCHLSDFLLPIP